MARLLQWHRWAGVLALSGVVLWSVSGTLHPIMARMQSRPVVPHVPAPPAEVQPPSAPATGGQPLAAVLARHGGGAISDARMLSIDGRAFYQVTRPGGGMREYYAVLDGSMLEDGDRRHAEWLARQYIGDTTAPVVSARLQVRFDAEYGDVNRLLPAWRIAFDRPDGMTVYVDTGTDRLGTLVDGTKRWTSGLFTTLHRWDWLDGLSPGLRLTLLGTMLLAAMGATLGGLWLFFVRRHAARTGALRRVHRLAGMALSLVALAFFASGLYHLLHLGLRGDPAARFAAVPARIDPAQLRIDFADAVRLAGIERPARISLAEVDGQPFYRVQPPRPPRPQPAHGQDPAHGGKKGPAGAVAHEGHAGHDGHAGPAAPKPPAPAVYLSTRDGTVLADGEVRHAAWIASRATSLAATASGGTVTRFGDEYGFVFKRLPVQRVLLEGPGRATAFVDTVDGAVSAVIDDADRREGWLFANMHKHDWMVPLVGRTARDVITASLALAIGVTATMGGVLSVRRRGARRLSAARVRPVY
jgi:hypothetical protein